MVENWWVQGHSESNPELLDAAALCRQLVPEGSVEGFLADHRHELFPDEMFEDLFPSGTSCRQRAAASSSSGLDSLCPCTHQFSTIHAQIASTVGRIVQQSPNGDRPLHSLREGSWSPSRQPVSTTVSRASSPRTRSCPVWSVRSPRTAGGMSCLEH